MFKGCEIELSIVEDNIISELPNFMKNNKGTNQTYIIHLSAPFFGSDEVPQVCRRRSGKILYVKNGEKPFRN
ncbi:hypothetical protein LguiA_030163 [Lonicera macranthoides]